ncbi:MAG: multiprotein bridging factor aMBF1 [Candidatus Woesearchaeota archaeon]
MICDMCGSQGTLYKSIIEGAELIVCHECSKFGKVVGVVKQEILKVKKDAHFLAGEDSKPEVMEMVSDDYAKKIKEKREQLGLNQEEFAKKLNEKESLIQKIESGHFEPSIGLAKKIQSFLKIKLIKEHEENHENLEHTKTDAFTIGDFIKVKKK